MAIQSKKSQFFLMSLVLIYLAIIVIFTYIRSADYTSVSLFDKNTELELENFIEQTKTRNNWLATNAVTYWLTDLAYQKRKLINITWTGAAPGWNYTVEIDLGFSSADLTNCTKEIRVYDKATGLDEWVDVTSSTPPCSVVWNLQNPSARSYYYYIYYNNPSATAPAHRTSNANGNTSGASWSYSPGTEEDSPRVALCKHLINIYSKTGIHLNCTIVTVGTSSLANTTINFTATDLTYDGRVI